MVRGRSTTDTGSTVASGAPFRYAAGTELRSDRQRDEQHPHQRHPAGAEAGRDEPDRGTDGEDGDADGAGECGDEQTEQAEYPHGDVRLVDPVGGRQVAVAGDGNEQEADGRSESTAGEQQGQVQRDAGPVERDQDTGVGVPERDQSKEREDGVVLLAVGTVQTLKCLAP